MKDELYDIMEKGDSLLERGQFEELDHILFSLETDSLTVLLAWLAVTRLDKKKLPSRSRLVDRVRELDPDRADRLLKGLT